MRRPKDALLSAIVGAWAVVVVPVLTPEPWSIEQAGMLLGGWLCIASLFRWRALRRTPERCIPITFAGTTGRFRLKVRRRGHEVIVQRGLQVVARASASPRGDRLVVHLDHVDDAELEPLGVAIGQAIHVVAEASDHPAGKRPRAASQQVSVYPLRFAPVPRTPPADRPEAPLSRPADSHADDRHARLPQHGRPRVAYRPLIGLTRRELARAERHHGQPWSKQTQS